MTSKRVLGNGSPSSSRSGSNSNLSQTASKLRPNSPFRGELDFDSAALMECKAAYLAIENIDQVEQNLTSRKQLLTALRNTGRNPTEKSMSKYWAPKTEYITFDEYLRICKSEPQTTEDDMIRAFRKFDVNGDGFISLGEFKRTMMTKGETMNDAEIKQFFAEVDTNRDGKLDYKEFCKLMLDTAKLCRDQAVRRLERKQKTSSGPRSREHTPDRASKLVNGNSPKNSPRPPSGKLGSSASVRSVAEDYESPKPAPRRTVKAKPPIISLDTKLSVPKKLQNWTALKRRGMFYVENGGSISSTQYTLTVTQSSSAWVTIAPVRYKSSAEWDRPTDVCLFIVNGKEASGNSLVTFTEKRDANGVHGVLCELKPGNYCLQAFTSGCSLPISRRPDDTKKRLVKKNVDGGYSLSPEFRPVLADVFDMVDTDMNGTLSRAEFSAYSLRTGETVGDEEWQVVEDNFELKNGELTMKGFAELVEMEAEDAEGDEDDLWLTLSSMGYDSSLLQTKAQPFVVEVWLESDRKASLVAMPTSLLSPSKTLSQTLREACISRGELLPAEQRSKNNQTDLDLNIYTYYSDSRAIVLIDNKSLSKVNVKLDCSASKNVKANRAALADTIGVPSKSSLVAYHLVPDNERQEWSFHCVEKGIQ